MIKKVLFSLVISLICLNCVQAQLAKPANWDSLFSIWNDTAQSVETRLEAMKFLCLDERDMSRPLDKMIIVLY